MTEVENYKNALINEINSFSTDAKVKSIFFGGGTPTAVDAYFICEIMDNISKGFIIKENAEITIESNPGTLTLEKAEAYAKSGINRISIGMQAWQNRLLKALGRIHTQEEFLKSYEIAERLFNVNVDLMFALPKQSISDWQETLENVTALNPEHISAYSLIVEEGTPFYDMYKTEPCDEKTDRQMYYTARDYLAEKGYYQYEISNFAKKGFESKHNLTYWQRGEYKGFGLGAASLLNNERLKNTENFKDYLKGIAVAEKESLTVDDQISEFMFLGLRCTKGISIAEFEKEFNKNIFDVFSKQLEKLKKEKLIEISEDRIYLTHRGIDLSNMVFVEFI